MLMRRIRLHSFPGWALPLLYGLVLAVGLVPARSIDAATPTVGLANGKLYLDGQLFKVRAIVYSPVPIGDTEAEPGAVQYDLPKIAALHANTLVTIKIGQFVVDQALSGDFTYYN